MPWRWQELVGIVLCMVTARTAAMAFNRLADRRIDADNPRTAGAAPCRPALLGVGSVAVFAGGCFAGVCRQRRCCFCRTGCRSIWRCRCWCFCWATATRSGSRRLAHFWLGAALMLAPVSAWIAIRGEYGLATPADLLPAVVLGGAVLLWVAGFDIIYACQDVEFDREPGCTACRRRWASRRRCGWPPPATWAWCAAGSACPLAFPIFELWADLLARRGGRGGAVDLRALAGAARRPGAASTALFQRQRRGQHRAVRW